MKTAAQIHQGDTREVMRKLIAEGVQVQTCVTSPPYWGLRDYGVAGQLGLEKTLEEFISNMVEVFDLVRDLLTPDGTLWLNLGDSYASAGKDRTIEQAVRNSTLASPMRQGQVLKQPPKLGDGLKPKDLIGVPWRVALALQADGWYLRQDIIWNKPNPMPESVTDRCTKAHEYIFLLSKSPRYYFDSDAIREPAMGIEQANGFRGGAYVNGNTFDNEEGGKRKTRGNVPIPSGWDTGPGSHKEKTGRYENNGVGWGHGTDKEERSRERVKKSGNKERKAGTARGCPKDSGSNVCGSVPWEGTTRNKRSVWTVASQPFKDAHFATFPAKLIEPCILAGSKQKDVVFDPFNGAGTTGLVALQNQRKYIGIEINPEYIKLTNKRLREIQVKMI